MWARAELRDRGSVTAEFAIVLPVVMVVLSLVIGAILLATHRLTLTSAAADVARLEARGDAAEAAARRAVLPAGVAVSRGTAHGLHCVTLRASPAGGLLAAFSVEATACAARSESIAHDAARSGGAARGTVPRGTVPRGTVAKGTMANGAKL